MTTMLLALALLMLAAAWRCWTLCRDAIVWPAVDRMAWLLCRNFNHGTLRMQCACYAAEMIALEEFLHCYPEIKHPGPPFYYRLWLNLVGCPDCELEFDDPLGDHIVFSLKDRVIHISLARQGRSESTLHWTITLWGHRLLRRFTARGSTSALGQRARARE